MAHISVLRSIGLALLLACLSAFPAGAVEFGDDGSRWANDGECDDPRFSGSGMTSTTLLESDALHDATDCRKAFEAGEIRLKAKGTKALLIPSAVPATAGPAPAAAVDFGDDSSQWANDGECDDPRFTGPGMTSTTLLDSDIRHDATDCRKGFEAGRLTLK